MEQSQAMTLIQVLTDSIGPRLTGTPNSLNGQDWIKKAYAGWGVTARSEQYGTWIGWKRGPSHAELLAPRVRSLEGTMLAWSPGTKGKPVQGAPVILADPADSAGFERQSRSVSIISSSNGAVGRARSAWRRQWFTAIL